MVWPSVARKCPGLEYPDCFSVGLVKNAGQPEKDPIDAFEPALTPPRMKINCKPTGPETRRTTFHKGCTKATTRPGRRVETDRERVIAASPKSLGQHSPVRRQAVGSVAHR